MDFNELMVIHGFFALPNRQKMRVVDAINEYFDSTSREEVRSRYDQQFELLDVIGNEIECQCCGRK